MEYLQNNVSIAVTSILLSVWGQGIVFLQFHCLPLQLDRIEDTDKKRTMLEDERLSPKIE